MLSCSLSQTCSLSAALRWAPGALSLRCWGGDRGTAGPELPRVERPHDSFLIGLTTFPDAVEINAPKSPNRRREQVQFLLTCLQPSALGSRLSGDCAAAGAGGLGQARFQRPLGGNRGFAKCRDVRGLLALGAPLKKPRGPCPGCARARPRRRAACLYPRTELRQDPAALGLGAAAGPPRPRPQPRGRGGQAGTFPGVLGMAASVAEGREL